MANFKPGAVVKVPFPYTDSATRQRRPAVVLAAPGDEYGLLWVAMITSAENRRWPCDIVISNHKAVGLPAPSMIRPVKIATIEAQDAEQTGRLNARDFAAVKGWIARTLEL